MLEAWAFETRDYVRITEARIDFMQRLLADLIPRYALQTALDVGCGIGHFSRRLADLGLKVTALDSRHTNTEEAARRNPDIKFMVQNIEEPLAPGGGSFDLVLCFGLLYHLENPFSAVRNLSALTGKVLLIESRVIPGHGPAASLVEETESHDQSMNYIALIPSESGFVKMLYRSGFTYVYRTRTLPEHDDFRETTRTLRKRTILLATHIPLSHTLLEPISEPYPLDPWLKQSASNLRRFVKFIQKPRYEKILAVQVRLRRMCNRLFPSLPLPVRLPYGGWWLAVNDTCSDVIATNSFESNEWRFIQRFLKKGMTVFDVGAHNGFYTLLAAKRVGIEGLVVAFEPSPRERQRLTANVHLNHCSQVKVEPFAISGEVGESPFFVVDGRQTAFNSLRPPAISAPSRRIMVKTLPLDDYIEREHIQHVDFLKIDAEGAELDILLGAQKLLGGTFRPLIMIEVSDLRTSEWGYQSCRIHEILSGFGYRWFTAGPEGQLQPYRGTSDHYNFIAVPEEQLTIINDFTQPGLNCVN